MVSSKNTSSEERTCEIFAHWTNRFHKTTPRSHTSRLLKKLDAERAKTQLANLMRVVYKFEIERTRIRVFGKFAFATLKIVYGLNISNHATKEIGRATLIFVKKDKWEFLHSHWSTGDPVLLTKVLSTSLVNFEEMVSSMVSSVEL